MKRILSSLSLAVALIFLAIACTPEKVTLTIDDNALVGTWQATDVPSEHWRYDADYTGETWDESDDVHEGEGTRFNWSTDADILSLDLYGSMGQHVYYDNTVTLQTSDSLCWKDLYGNSRTFVKI